MNCVVIWGKQFGGISQLCIMGLLECFVVYTSTILYLCKCGTSFLWIHRTSKQNLARSWPSPYGYPPWMAPPYGAMAAPQMAAQMAAASMRMAAAGAAARSQPMQRSNIFTPPGHSSKGSHLESMW